MLQMEAIARKLDSEAQLCLHTAVSRMHAALNVTNFLLKTLVERSQTIQIGVPDMRAPSPNMIEYISSGFFKALQFDMTYAAACSDQDSVFKYAQTAGPEQQGAVTGLARSKRFGGWFGAPKSGIFIINGGSETNDKITPVSYLCALLTQSLRSQGQSHSAFFCSKMPAHEISAIHLLRSLIVQTYRTAPQGFKLEFLIDIIKSDNDYYTPRILGEILFQIVIQLPEGSVLAWIIDGLSFYESLRSEMGRWTREVARELESIVHRATNLVIKLLLTYPGKQTSSSYRFVGAQVMYVQDDMDGNGSGEYQLEMLQDLGRRRSYRSRVADRESLGLRRQRSSLC